MGSVPRFGSAELAEPFKHQENDGAERDRQ
jgi:hypothetical protein